MEEIAKRDQVWDAALYQLVTTGSTSAAAIADECDDVSTHTANSVLRMMEEHGYVVRESPSHHTFKRNNRCYLFAGHDQ